MSLPKKNQKEEMPLKKFPTFMSLSLMSLSLIYTVCFLLQTKWKGFPVFQNSGVFDLVYTPHLRLNNS